MTAIEAFADAIMEHEGWFGASTLHPLGSRSWRNRNPGNLRHAPMQSGSDNQGYAIFNSLVDGYQALKDDLYAKCTGHTTTGLGPDSTLEQFFEVYAPAKDGNDPAAYARTVADFVSRATGKILSSSSKLGELVA